MEHCKTDFAFGWENPKIERKIELCWIMLPQSFKNSLTIFGNQLSKGLEGWQQEHLEAVDNLIVAATQKEII